MQALLVSAAPVSQPLCMACDIRAALCRSMLTQVIRSCLPCIQHAACLTRPACCRLSWVCWHRALDHRGAGGLLCGVCGPACGSGGQAGPHAEPQAQCHPQVCRVEQQQQQQQHCRRGVSSFIYSAPHLGLQHRV